MGADEPALGGAGRSRHLLGNDAVVRGALEAGVGLVAGYPGTPSSEITDGFARVAASHGVEFEYAVNEKIALEIAFAAAIAGARSLCAMKHLGLMVAGDPLSTIPYVGVRGGMVIVSAGDPSCHTSPNEADQRHLGPMLHVPILDPSTPAEAHAMTRAAFELSETCKLPVLLRTTTRVAHSRGEVAFGPLQAPRKAEFVRDPARWIPVPAHARRMRLEVTERLAAAAAWMERSGFFRVEGSGEDVVLASGAPAATASDVLRALGAKDKVALWRLGTVHPLPERELVRRLREARRVLVVEELSPFLENALLALCARHDLGVKILGKHSGHMPPAFEYTPDVVQRGLSEALGLGAPPRPKPAPLPVAPRAPTLCPGCPHRAAFFAARAALGDEQIWAGDIGCYTLGWADPLSATDALLCMGAGFTLAIGIARVTGKRVVGFMGDSTFFHSGMPAVLDAAKENANVTLVVLDNQVTAMTGFQESPTENKNIEHVARALGLRHVESVDPYDLEASVAAVKRAHAARGPSMVVFRRDCPVHLARTGERARSAPFEADRDACRTCGRAAFGLRCDVPLTDGYERNLARVAAQRPKLEPKPDVAPCAELCPLSLCIQGYAGHLAAGEYAEALQHVMARTPLPDAVCRVCHKPCEDACVRGSLDAPVAVNDLKRFLVEWATRERPELFTTPAEPPSGFRVAVVGAGPSGLTAAHELAVRGHAVTLYDAEARPGGLLTHGIPEHRLPAADAHRDVERVLALGVKFVGGARLGRDVHLSELAASNDAVYVAIGAHVPRALELPGEGPPTIEALRYLRAVRLGEAAPAGARVVVVGGGNAAVDAARTALRRGASSVTMACLEARAAMPALEEEIVLAEKDGVRLLDGARPARWLADALSVTRGGEDVRLDADLVIVAIGQDPDRAALEGFALDVDRDTCRTSHPRVWAGGDAVSSERMVTTAMAWGLRAAWSIDVELRGRERADRRPPPQLPRAEPRAVKATAPSVPRRHAAEGAALSEADARAEAMRCLMCGMCGNCRACIDALGCPAIAMHLDGKRVAVDPAWCIGCGVCEEVCSNGAMRQVGEP